MANTVFELFIVATLKLYRRHEFLLQYNNIVVKICIQQHIHKHKQSIRDNIATYIHIFLRFPRFSFFPLWENVFIQTLLSTATQVSIHSFRQFWTTCFLCVSLLQTFVKSASKAPQYTFHFHNFTFSFPTFSTSFLTSINYYGKKHWDWKGIFLVFKFIKLEENWKIV